MQFSLIENAADYYNANDLTGCFIHVKYDSHRYDVSRCINLYTFHFRSEEKIFFHGEYFYNTYLLVPNHCYILHSAGNKVVITPVKNTTTDEVYVKIEALRQLLSQLK